MILADKPTGALDSRTVAEMMELFQELNAQGPTIFMVTHNKENAKLVHRVLQIRNGRLASNTMPGRSCAVFIDAVAMPVNRK